MQAVWSPTFVEVIGRTRPGDNTLRYVRERKGSKSKSKRIEIEQTRLPEPSEVAVSSRDTINPRDTVNPEIKKKEERNIGE